MLIVDRIDLEGQLWGTFSNVDFPYSAKAESTKDLANKLKRESREVIITTIQKFEDIRDVLSKQENLIVFVDEANRSQYGKLAMHMRRAFPNAFIFGFTGTPIEKGALGRSTFRTFCPLGEKYLDRYGVRESIEDCATVRIVYEPRLEKFQVPRAILDREFLDRTRGLADEEQQRVIDKSATLKTVMKSKERVDKIARDVAEHFRTHVEQNGVKAQLVAVDREGCALYKEALDKYLPPVELRTVGTAGGACRAARPHQLEKASFKAIMEMMWRLMESACMLHLAVISNMQDASSTRANISRESHGIAP